MFQYAPMGIIVIDRQGIIQLSNPCIEKYFGYRKEELIGKQIEILIPDTRRKKHEQHLEKYFNKPRARPMGYGLNLFARKKDGSEFPVEISLAHYELYEEQLAVAFITDITEKIKAEERAANPDKSALAGVALALPALERAAKLQRRAARTGFDWPDVSGPRAKIDEELAELEAETEHPRMLEELGDLLFAVVNLARHLNIEPEAALREANRKFEERFRAIEQEPGFEQMSLDEKEALWTRAKKAQADSSA